MTKDEEIIERVRFGIDTAEESLVEEEGAHSLIAKAQRGIITYEKAIYTLEARALRHRNTSMRLLGVLREVENNLQQTNGE